MARWRDDRDPIEERLCRFVAGEWAGHEDPVAAWGRAARQWLADHPGRELPWARDPVEILQEVVAVKRRIAREGGYAGPPFRRPWGRDVGGGSDHGKYPKEG